MKDWLPEPRRGVFPNIALPLVNLVFLLLGFFILAGRIEPPPQAPINLVEGEGRRSAETEHFSLTKEGALYYQGRAVSLEEAASLWAARQDPSASRGSAPAAPIIAADADTPARDLAKLLNLLSETDAVSAILLLRAR